MSEPLDRSNSGLSELLISEISEPQSKREFERENKRGVLYTVKVGQEEIEKKERRSEGKGERKGRKRRKERGNRKERKRWKKRKKIKEKKGNYLHHPILIIIIIVI